MKPDTITMHATTLLDAAREALAWPDGKRGYICWGEPIADCEQLTVHLSRIYFGPPAGATQDRARRPSRSTLPSIALTVSLWRCGTTGADPTVADLEETSLALNEDLAVVVSEILRRHHNGALFGGCNSVVFREVMLKRSGGMVGFAMPIDLVL